MGIAPPPNPEKNFLEILKTSETDKELKYYFKFIIKINIIYMIIIIFNIFRSSRHQYARN
jgi:hypothetical protein